MSDATRLCQVCGRALQSQSRFCPQCGAPLSSNGVPLGPGGHLKGGDYVIVRALTRGGMGAVYLAEDRRAFDRPCIVKQMLDYYDPADPSERERAAQRFEEEGRTLAALSHPGAPQIYTFFQEGGRFYIVMEYVRGENLETFVTHEGDDGQAVRGTGLPREEVLRYIIQVCDILEYLHNQPRPVVHQDIKPANLVLDRQRGLVRLVDFGTARMQPDRIKRPAVADPSDAPAAAQESTYGTDGYAPPEQYRGQAVPKSDVFALAATAYHLLTDDDPRQHPFKFPRLAELPKELRATLERALRNKPEDRCTARELRQALEALTAPQRTLETFAFPGGTQIRSVAALPTLCDEYWDSARSFLYNGDFTRWLRDLNRHDLATAAEDIVKHQGNRDAGLEAFLHVVDPGLPHPKLVCDPADVDLGSIGRVAALTRRVTLLNTRRGYAQVRVHASEPWVQVFPDTVNLWSGIPSDVRIRVLAEGLPLRSSQQASVRVEPVSAPVSHGHTAVERALVDDLVIPVTAHVSLWREGLRLLLRALGAAVPASWRAARHGWQVVGRVSQKLARPFVRHSWLLWVVWLLAGAALGAGLYLLPNDLPLPVGSAGVLRAPTTVPQYIAPVLLGPPVLASVLWLAFIVIMVAGRALIGAIVGAVKALSR